MSFISNFHISYTILHSKENNFKCAYLKIAFSTKISFTQNTAGLFENYGVNSAVDGRHIHGAMFENFMAKMSYFWQFSAPCLRGLLCMGKQEVGNRRGGCSGAVKNTNTTHNLAFTFLLSSSKHRQLLKGCTV